MTPDPGVSSMRQTTCYMCTCRCGINVHLRDGVPIRIEGNPAHPKNRGVLCGKGAAGLQHHFSAARLRKPLKRVGPRGEASFVEIEWDEALDIATTWLDAIRRSDPRRPAFFTGGDQSQSLTGWWAAQFGTRTSPRTADCARSTSLRPGCTPSADRFGSSGSPTGTEPSTFFSWASPRTTIPTRSKSASAS